MERTQRLVFLVLLIGWTIFRLLRYVRMANSKRGPLPQRPTPTTPAKGQSPLEPEGKGDDRNPIK